MTVFDYALTMLRRAAEMSYTWPISPTEAGELVTEIERLRSRVDDLERAREFVRLKATLHERAAVMAYLRAPGTSCDTDVLANAIERGDHRREGER